MRFRFRKRPNRSPKAQRPWQLPPAIPNDPAFSADPTSHPYHYLTGYECLLVIPGHPTIQGRRGRRPRRPAEACYAQSETDSVELIQPPNSPAPADNNNETPLTFIVPQPFKDPSSATPRRPSMTTSLAKPPKKFGFLTKRRPAKQETDPGIATGQRSEENEPSISQQPQKSTLQRHKSAPDPRTHQLEQQQQGISAWAVSPQAESINHWHTASNSRALPKQRFNLDSIDELDETHLFGPLHHDGPYEAIYSIVGSRMPLGLSDNGRLHQHHERTMKAVGHVYMPPEVPPGISLNLSPGQVLPRNFKRQAGKPPRLRNNLVSPLPPGEVQKEVEIAPRHANFNEIPFHKGNRKPKQRQTRDNPLEGPPIDPAIAIGLAMMHFHSGTDEDNLPATPNPAIIVQQEPEVVDIEYNPYALENIENHPINAPLPTEEGPQPCMGYSLGEEMNEPDHGVHLNVEAPRAIVSLSPYSHSPSPNLRLKLPARGIYIGASEETLVQKEEEIDCLEDVSPFPNEHSNAIKLEVIVSKLEQAPPAFHVAPQDFRTNSVDGGYHHLDSSFPDPPATQACQNMETTPNAFSPQPSIARRYDKQLPYPPTSTPPIEQISHLTNDSSQPELRPVREREWRNSALQKAMKRSDSRMTNRSSVSYQSHTSTKGDDGHSPTLNMLGQATSNATPQMMSQVDGTAPSSSPLISRKDADPPSRYPIPRPSPLPAPPSQERNLRPGLAQRANSTSSSKKSFQLSPIQEDAPLPQSLSSFAQGPLTSYNQRLDPQPAQGRGLQRSKSSVQPRLADGQIQIGQVYPRQLQGSSLQRSTSQHVSEGRPPAYSEEGSYDQPSPPQLQYQFSQQQMQNRTQVKAQVEMELRRQDSPLQIPPVSESRAPMSTSRPLNLVQPSKLLQDGEKNQPRNPQGQEYSIRDNSNFAPPTIMSNNTSSTGMRFQPHHLPKKLVMPAPLQQPNRSHEVMPQAQHFNDIFGPRPTLSDRIPPSPKTRTSRQVMNREPSPPNVLPPLLSHSEVRLDPAFSAGRKLKKRISYVPPPPNRLDISLNTALDFKPTISMPSLNDKPAVRAKPIHEKTAKRVLSKKRTKL